jgi:hypothetical protein
LEGIGEGKVEKKTDKKRRWGERKLKVEGERSM